MVEHAFTKLPFSRIEYNAEYAQRNAESKYSAKAPETEGRTEFGHCAGTRPACLLTHTKRKPRFEITRKIESRSMQAVTHELDVLEWQIEASLFRRMFKTVTGDNGSEFSDIEGMERSALSAKQRLTLYFAHPTIPGGSS